MVSGLVTSPWDQLRIFSGEARLIRIASKSAIAFPRSNGLERYKLSSFPAVPFCGMQGCTALRSRPRLPVLRSSSGAASCGSDRGSYPDTSTRSSVGGHWFGSRQLLAIVDLDQFHIQAKRLQL